ncbi:hypothetical protein FisN_7Hu397 [Fistulifera solaris]|uniref:Uncharacterized protein n=1 Tax=Fistulifera solaris TaxID=1519565 RepID=A0A1Z5KSE1_FISSO|nr:hypothetical protein FisN_7Hu397 [Fistulifera solaris]|eukprot:GAX29012.1 hypothetical protein FisN_7Hu397 [Fistulifera solaris]
MPYRLSKYDSLLEVIPEELRTPEQVAQWRGGHQTPTYKLRRDPRNFCEVERYEEMTAIWMENETLVQVTQGVRFPHFDKFQNVENSLRLVVALFNPTRNIVIEISGKADDAVADTAMYWWSLHCPENCDPCLRIDNQCDKFDFGTIKIKHLATLFARNPTRRLRINGVKLNSDQLSFLATRDHPIDLTFEYSNVLEDEGDAFVRSLQIRELPFGSLHFLGTAFPISDDNVERLVQLPIFDKLTLPEWDDDREFLPFSAPVRALEYRIHTSKVQAANIQAINVVPEDLTVKIWIDDWDDGEEEATLSLLSRLAGSGQLHHLGVKFEGGGIDFVEPNHSKSISEELIKTVLANKELVSLDIDVSFIFQQVHLTEFLESLDDHKALHTVTIEVHEEDVDFSDSSWLKILLSRNRRIEIYGDWMLSVMNWDDLHKVHSFNRFYTGCKSLKESTRSFRTKMLVTALEECACQDFKRTAFLLTSSPTRCAN